MFAGIMVGVVFGNKPDGLLSTADLVGAFIAGMGYSSIFCTKNR
jgi:hypothetical protein